MSIKGRITKKKGPKARKKKRRKPKTPFDANKVLAECKDIQAAKEH